MASRIKLRALPDVLLSQLCTFVRLASALSSLFAAAACRQGHLCAHDFGTAFRRRHTRLLTSPSRCCRFPYLMTLAPAPSLYASTLAGVYIALKGRAYVRDLSHLALALRNAVFGGRRFGTKVTPQEVLEGGSLPSPRLQHMHAHPSTPLPTCASARGRDCWMCCVLCDASVYVYVLAGVVHLQAWTAFLTHSPRVLA